MGQLGAVNQGQISLNKVICMLRGISMILTVLSSQMHKKSAPSLC